MNDGTLQQLLDYDALGNRVRQTLVLPGQPTLTTDYLLDIRTDLTQLLRETTNGGPTTDDTWYMLGLDIIGQQQNGAWSYFGYDGLGSVRHLTDEYGSITARMSYDPYGAPLQSNTASSLGFTGELTYPTGFVYLRARTYNPTLGIFTSRDPVLGVAGLSASYNGYGYVYGNPTNYRDPSGECPDGLGIFQCVAYDALDTLNRASVSARQIIGIGAYVTATEVSPRAAAVSDWVLEHSGTYDLLDDLSYIARHIDRDLLGNASQGTIQRGDMRRAL